MQRPFEDGVLLSQLTAEAFQLGDPPLQGFGLGRLMRRECRLAVCLIFAPPAQ